jgi:hypothetical protein
MQAVVGVFRTQAEAERAAARLQGRHARRISLFGPGTTHADLAAFPTSADMPPVGWLIGGTLGLCLGLGFGACFFMPGLGFRGVDPFTITGVIGTLFAGYTGMSLGAMAGRAVDNRFFDGLPVDELYVYEDALRQGRTVLMALTDQDEEAAAERAILAESGAESVDAAHRNWRVGWQSDPELAYGSLRRGSAPGPRPAAEPPAGEPPTGEPPTGEPPTGESPTGGRDLDEEAGVSVP